VNCNNYVDKDEKYSSVLRQYKIASIAADTMVINTEKILYKDNNGNVIEEKGPGEKGDIEKSDVVTPSKNSMSLLYLALPVIAFVAIISVVLIRRMKKK
jgi:hypothetical protein